MTSKYSVLHPKMKVNVQGAKFIVVIKNPNEAPQLKALDSNELIKEGLLGSKRINDNVAINYVDNFLSNGSDYNFTMLDTDFHDKVIFSGFDKHFGKSVSIPLNDAFSIMELFAKAVGSEITMESIEQKYNELKELVEPTPFQITNSEQATITTVVKCVGCKPYTEKIVDFDSLYELIARKSGATMSDCYIREIPVPLSNGNTVHVVLDEEIFIRNENFGFNFEIQDYGEKIFGNVVIVARETFGLRRLRSLTEAEVNEVLTMFS